MLGLKINASVEIDEARRRVGSGPKEYKARGALVVDGLMLVVGLHVKETTFAVPNLCGWFIGCVVRQEPL